MIKLALGYLTRHSAYLAWAVALAATLISLSLSEVFNLTPCVLCWYQRICMYPLTVIMGVGIIRRSRDWQAMALILATVGGVIALYHSLLQWSIIPESLAPCRAGISCTTKQIDYFGFITIPFGALVAFAAILLLVGLNLKGGQHESGN